MLVRMGFELATFRSADWRSPNWANQSAERCYIDMFIAVRTLVVIYIKWVSLNLEWNKNVPEK